MATLPQPLSPLITDPVSIKLAAVEARLAALEAVLKIGPSGDVTLKASNLSIEAISGVMLKCGSTLSLEAGSGAMVKCGSALTLDGGASMTLKTWGTMNIQSSATMTVKGSLITLN